VKKCPNQLDTQQMAIALSAFSPAYGSNYYSVNQAAAGNEWGPGSKSYDPTFKGGVFTYFGASGSDVQRPAETFLAWEHLSRVPLCNFLQTENWYTSPPNNQGDKDHFNFLHRDGTNTVWADGHAKRFAYGQLRRPFFSCRKDIYPNDGDVQ